MKVCHNILKEGTPYLDFDLKIKKRLSVDFKDYVIIRIPCPVNTEFYQLQFEHDSDSFCVYDYSYLHKGAVSFEKCKVLPLDAHSGHPLFMLPGIAGWIREIMISRGTQQVQETFIQ